MYLEKTKVCLNCNTTWEGGDYCPRCGNNNWTWLKNWEPTDEGGEPCTT